MELQQCLADIGENSWPFESCSKHRNTWVSVEEGARIHVRGRGDESTGVRAQVHLRTVLWVHQRQLYTKKHTYSVSYLTIKKCISAKRVES